MFDATGTDIGTLLYAEKMHATTVLSRGRLFNSSSHLAQDGREGVGLVEARA